MDFLQIPLSIVFTSFLNVFSEVIPDIGAEGKNAAVLFGIRLAVLALALLFTGVGAALSLNMRIVPNPGDGIVQAIADECHKSVGFIKNCVDVTCVATIIVSDLQSLYKAKVNADDGSGRIGNLVQLHKKFQALLRKRR